MLVRDAKFEDVENVMDQISEISGMEMIECSVDTAWKGMLRAKMCKDKGFLKVAEQDGKLLWVFGGVRDYSTINTWFVGTSEYFSSPKYVKGSKKAVAKIALWYKNFVIQAATRSRHPNTVHWFSVMGFRFIENREGAMVFHYGPNSTNTTDNANLPPEMRA